MCYLCAIFVLRLCYVCAMEDKETRSYAKESTKSKPTGVRFDLEQLEYVKGREKLKTNQKVVDFLLNKYWWEYKVAVPSHKGLPKDYSNPISDFPKEQKYTEISGGLLIPSSDEPLSFDKMKQELAAVDSFADFKTRIFATSEISEIQSVMADVKASVLFWKEKQMLETIAKDHSKDFFND